MLAAIEDSSFWFRHRNRVISSTVKRFSGAETVFEIGGGNGYVSLGLQRGGIGAVVVEPGAEGAAVAFERGLPVINAAFSSSLFAAESLPAIGLFDVIEHIADDKMFLTECFKTLRPGGFIYVTVPAHQALWSVDDEYAGHFRRYDRGSLTEVLRAAGFAPQLVTSFFMMLVPPLFLLRTLPSKLGQRKVESADAAFAHHDESIVSRAMERALAFEVAAIGAGRALPFGTSMLAVAQKPAS